ncbi:HPF/RaiA family ribosome-associated protein [Pontiellaceae bacterium B12227]|nr:HPF/RaiA family ribosome-associated protein [Pontiellaceae bacterium B12227]
MNTHTNLNRITVNVQFRHMPKSRSIKQLVQAQAERLHRFDLPGGHCEVVIDEMHHFHKGGIFKVSLRLKVPGERLYVAHAEEVSGTHEFLYSAVRTVFDEVEVQLKKRRRKNIRRKGIELAA